MLKADGSPTRGRGKENKSMSATAVCSRCNGLSRRPESLDTIHKELQATARSSGGEQIWGRRRRRDRAEGRSVIMKMHEQKKRLHRFASRRSKRSGSKCGGGPLICPSAVLITFISRSAGSGVGKRDTRARGLVCLLGGWQLVNERVKKNMNQMYL